MFCKTAFLIILAVNFLPECGRAATLKASATKDGRVIISLAGEIAEGDAESLKAAIKTANDAGKLVTSIRLDSIGGSLAEGVRLAEIAKFAKLAANVGQGATCASACFLIFAAGETKFANYTAQIGVHGASDSSGEETVQSGAATITMGRYLKNLGVPSAIIGRMVITPPSEMVWLTPSDLRSVGTTMVGKPSQLVEAAKQTAAPVQLAPQSPVQITPSAKASIPPSWDKVVETAVRISAAQNGGKARSGRTCQPELKVCINAVMYRNTDGFEAFLKVTRDMNEVILRRELCTFNKSKDIRKCLDWDNETMHRDMQASDGSWSKIADE